MVTSFFILPAHLSVPADSCICCLSPARALCFHLLSQPRQHPGAALASFLPSDLLSSLPRVALVVSSVFNRVYEGCVLLTLQSCHSGQGGFCCLANSNCRAWSQLCNQSSLAASASLSVSCSTATDQSLALLRFLFISVLSDLTVSFIGPFFFPWCSRMPPISVPHAHNQLPQPQSTESYQGNQMLQKQQDCLHIFLFTATYCSQWM